MSLITTRETTASATRWLRAKRAFYRQPAVVAAYDEQRFGGAGGARVNARERQIIANLLPEGGVVADIGCGTGRLLDIERDHADTLLAFDTSFPMLRAASGRGADGVVEADALSLPLADGACDTIVCVRLLFHVPRLISLLGELRRISRDGGTLVCDTCTWSPRALLPLDPQRWGEAVVATSEEAFARAAAATGWRVRTNRPCFLVSPYLYRRVPPLASRMLEQAEHHVPRALLCREFWALEAC